MAGHALPTMADGMELMPMFHRWPHCFGRTARIATFITHGPPLNV